MTRPRFQLALRHLPATGWQLFEDLASAFTADEFPNLRTMADESGDGGRDGLLSDPDGDPTVVVQYSVSEGWERKINATLRRLQTTTPECAVLVYATNQRIGPDADDLKRRVRMRRQIHLDIRDQSWFLDRQNMTLATQAAAEEFASRVADPLLADPATLEQRSQILTSHEERVAVVYLTLQYEDEAREKGLTKLCFQALVRAALRNTDGDNRMPRAEIHDAILKTLPSHDAVLVRQYTDSALSKLAKNQVSYWQREDEYCLRHEERVRIVEGLSELAVLDDELADEIASEANALALALDIHELPMADLLSRVRRVIEHFLLQRGESFVESLSSGQAVMLVAEEIEALAIADLAGNPDTAAVGGELIPLVAGVAEALINRPGPTGQRYLHALADGYTLFAFLKETPDVQGAVSKMFSGGEIWLDTSAALPMLVETLLDDDERQYTTTVAAARAAGVRLYVTPGALNELDSHITHSHRAQQLGADWRSRTPFLLAGYLWSGRDPAKFGSWLENFRGPNRPLDDIADFLKDIAGIEVRSLAKEVEEADESLRFAIAEFWHEVHANRGERGSRDPEVSRTLAEHDLENFLGVLERRRHQSAESAFGYQSWWLTLDRSAYGATDQIVNEYGVPSFMSPVMSVDFLVNYLSVGPARARVARSIESTLPLMTDMSLLDGVPDDLMRIASETRAELEGLPERIVRRKVRDRLDLARATPGSIAVKGIEGIQRDMETALRDRPQ